MVVGGWYLLAGIRRLEKGILETAISDCPKLTGLPDVPNSYHLMEGSEWKGTGPVELIRARAVEQSCLILNFFRPFAFREAKEPGRGYNQLHLGKHSNVCEGLGW